MALNETTYQLMLGASGLVIVILLIVTYKLARRQREEAEVTTVMQIQGEMEHDELKGPIGTSGAKRSQLILAPPLKPTPAQQLEIDRVKQEAERRKQEAQQLKLESMAYYQENAYGSGNPYSQFD